MRNGWLIAALSLLAFSLGPAPMSTAKEFQFDYQKILSTGQDAELTLTYVSGNLLLTQSDDDRLIIEARKRVSAVSSDEAQIAADHIEIKVDQKGRKVTVAANYLRMRNQSRTFWTKVLGTGGEDAFGQVDWSIRVPVGTRVSIVNTDGAVKISHVAGDVSVRSSAADIELTSIEGSVSVESSSGSVAGELLFGSVDIRQALGRIDLKFVEGDIRVKSSSAAISIRQDQGALDLTTGSGNVDIQTNLDSSRDYFVNTESGHIRLTIPETSSGDLRIESQTGDIKTEIPITIKSMSRKQVEGTFGFGGVKINLTSVSGDVTVAQF
ncbi:MAG: DUF4097 family beta strand repeat-containing protein [Candidatus Zixiibacteriota bacterium]